MPRPLNDSPYLYGLHDPGGEGIMAEQKTPGWILFTEALGCDPADRSGHDYSSWANRGFGIIARLNNGYSPGGSIPSAVRYPQFAQRCANFAASSPGCHIWIIGNEMNYAVERPGVQYDAGGKLLAPGEVILPGAYADCYRRCRVAIRALPGHRDDQVITGAVAPWNNQTSYPANPNGDWVTYFADMLDAIGAGNCDGISLHAYTHGPDPSLIYGDTYMNPPFQKRQYNFRCYQDFMAAIPADMRGLPVYLTETDQNVPWVNQDTGWVQRVYGEIDWWNQQIDNQPIRAVILYRWRKDDQWYIDGKQGVIDDFKRAMAACYTWPTRVPPIQPDLQPITFPDTGHTARGPFAAFYRKYGAEITGSPISDQYVAPDSGLNTQDWQRVMMEEYPSGKIRLRRAGQQLLEARQQIGQLQARVGQLQAQVGELQTEIGQLQERIADLQGAQDPERGSGLPRPPMVDITEKLARDPAGFVKRSEQDIKYIVINHTAVPPEVGAERVAQAQRTTWPGIISQFYITGDGQIQQTEPLDAAVARAQSWLYNGINIYVAGNFSTVVPSDAQLTALARLVAWLMQKYRLDESAVRGAQEFYPTQSPGQQWVSGQRWKDTLLKRVRAVAAEAANRAAPSRTAMGLATDVPPGPAAPAVNDVSRQLPREPGALKPRPVDQVKYLVFNHTAADGSVGIEQIAAAHRKRWGAILYQYLVLEDGTILQTEPVDQVVDAGAAWIAQGINIGLAGNFSVDVPAPAQLDAAARLAAWLMQQYGIPVDNVRGASEFIATQSPGTQWLQGKVWKHDLLARVAEVQASVGGRARSGGPAGQAAGSTGRAPESRAGVGNAASISPPPIRDITGQLPKHPTERYSTRPLNKITHLAIHHSAAPANVSPQSIAAYHVKQGWPGIGYHFMVEAEGTIFQVNRLETIAYNVYNHNSYLVGICAAGNFNNVVPTPRQIESLARLVAWLMQKLNIPAQNVLGHREYPDNASECPGNEWESDQNWKDMLMARVRAIQALAGQTVQKSIGHYVLFWQNPHDWAQDDWLGAKNYIGRFRPTAGFSFDDARAADYVTIIGGPLGVSPEIEQALVAAGCKVERIAGTDTAETKQILDDLAASGKRFKTYDV